MGLSLFSRHTNIKSERGGASLLIVAALGISAAMYTTQKFKTVSQRQNVTKVLKMKTDHDKANRQALKRFTAYANTLESMDQIPDTSTWEVSHIAAINEDHLKSLYEGKRKDFPGKQKVTIRVKRRNAAEGLILVEASSPKKMDHPVTQEAMVNFDVLQPPVTAPPANPKTCADFHKSPPKENYKVINIDAKNLKKKTLRINAEFAFINITAKNRIKKLDLYLANPNGRYCVTINSKKFNRSSIRVAPGAKLAEVEINTRKMFKSNVSANDIDIDASKKIRKSAITGNNIKVRGKKIRKTKIKGKNLKIKAKHIGKSKIKGKNVKISAKNIRKTKVRAKNVKVKAKNIRRVNIKAKTVKIKARRNIGKTKIKAKNVRVKAEKITRKTSIRSSNANVKAKKNNGRINGKKQNKRSKKNKRNRWR
ncbi:MAG: hypothetical protein CMP10_18460 [Zetaproteobacteria bacterium]|nr:hypothetical protein [Pseudobdellovibrionaceae bacterium]